MKEETMKVKCERCGRIRDLFQYTHFEEDKIINVVRDRGSGENPRFVMETQNLEERRGLCEECGVEVNKRKYDSPPQ